MCLRQKELVVAVAVGRAGLGYFKEPRLARPGEEQLSKT